MKEDDVQAGRRDIEITASRLKTVFAGTKWSVERAVALGHILHVYGVEFDDGTVFNGNDTETAAGIGEAAAVISLVCDTPAENAAFWEGLMVWGRTPRKAAGRAAPQLVVDSSTVEELERSLLTTLRAASGVRRVGVMEGHAEGS